MAYRGGFCTFGNIESTLYISSFSRIQSSFITKVENSSYDYETETNLSSSNFTNLTKYYIAPSSKSPISVEPTSSQTTERKYSGISYFDSIYFIVVTMSTVGYFCLFKKLKIEKIV